MLILSFVLSFFLFLFSFVALWIFCGFLAAMISNLLVYLGIFDDYHAVKSGDDAFVSIAFGPVALIVTIISFLSVVVMGHKK